MNIGGYELATEFTTTGGGRCRWAFARRDDDEYFLKCFLSPKQFIPGKSAGGRATMEARQAACRTFEDRQSRLLTALDGKTGLGGNLIAPLDFFSFDGCYYKVTEKIKDHGLKFDQIRHLPEPAQMMLLRSAAGAVRVLHSGGLVHGDIKVDNIIIRRRDERTFTASVIDFDDSYFQGEPPTPPEEFTFDPPYAAPEIFRYIPERNPRTAKSLTTAADVFSLGVVFCEYLTGEKPTPVGSIRLPSAPRAAVAMDVVRSMLALDPRERPALKSVLDRLTGPRGAPIPPTAKIEAADKPRLVINMRTAPKPSATAGAGTVAGSATTGSRLRGTLFRKTDP